MSNHCSLKLHPREEAVAVNVTGLLREVPHYLPMSPIADYFSATDRIIKKIVAPGIDDAEMFGLLTIGVISAAEFYLRNIFGRVPEICPIAKRHMEMSSLPVGAMDFYSGSAFPRLLAIFDHESLADGGKIRAAASRCTGLKLSDDGSVDSVIDEFDRLCELRHCLVHASGYAGLKACNALQVVSRAPHKVLMSRGDVLEVVKISHNMVRAVNRYLADEISNRWVDKGILTGDWAVDKFLFSILFRTFYLNGQDAYMGNAYRAYLPFGKAARARAQAILAKT